MTKWLLVRASVNRLDIAWRCGHSTSTAGLITMFHPTKIQTTMPCRIWRFLSCCKIPGIQNLPVEAPAVSEACWVEQRPRKRTISLHSLFALYLSTILGHLIKALGKQLNRPVTRTSFTSFIFIWSHAPQTLTYPTLCCKKRVKNLKLAKGILRYMSPSESIQGRL